MDAGLRQELNSIIEKLTHSGLPSLNQELLKKLKRLCKSSDAYIRATHETVMSHLAKNHAEIRLSSFQIIDDLFQRSHLFRELLLSDFQQFTRLVTGTEPKHPLPLPKAVAAKLKEKSLLAIRQWHDKYGEGYPRLKLSYNFLKSHKKVNFDELVAQSEAVRRRQQEREARQAAMKQQRLRDIKQEMNDMRLDIEDCLAQVESCFNLLVPRFDIPDIYSSAESQESSFELTPPHHQSSKETEEAVGGEEQKREERKRKRTVSSGSFVSLSSGDESDDDSGKEEREIPSSVHTACANEEGETPSLVHTACTDKEGETPLSVHTACTNSCNKEGETPSLACVNQQKKSNESVRDEDILRRLYASYSTTSASAEGHGLKLGVVTSTGSTKGKGKLKSDITEVVEGESCEGTGGANSSDSDSSSDVEWEDVPMSGSHDQGGADLQEHGLTSRGFSIPITIELSTQPEVRETEDNASIIATLHECKQLLSEKYLPTINRWMEWMTKAGGEEENLRKAIDFKNKVVTTLNKFQRLKVIYTNPPPSSSSSSLKRPGEDGYEEQAGTATRRHRPQATAAEWEFGNSYSSVPHSDMEQDPTTPEAQLARLKKKLDTKESRSESSLLSSVSSQSQSGKVVVQRGHESKVPRKSKVPIVPYGMDLYYWDKPKDVEPMTLAPIGSLHRFWVQEHEVSISEEEKARLRCRAITYAGEFEPVKRSCRAPLPNGSLCPRRDRIKCPFHGVIIPRDEHGNPVQSSSGTPHSSNNREQQVEISDIQSSSKEAGELWSDLQIQNDIMAAARLDSQPDTSGTKKRKGRRRVERKKKYPGLTDLKVHTDTPRKRLEKKVLNKRSLKRIAEVQEKAAAKQYQDKFGYSFNYALRS